MDKEVLKKSLYRICFNNQERLRADKIINLFSSRVLNKENYWDNIRKLTKNVYSDHALSSWQCLAERAEKEIFLSL
jgi:hypothetical protein